MDENRSQVLQISMCSPLAFLLEHNEFGNDVSNALQPLLDTPNQKISTDVVAPNGRRLCTLRQNLVARLGAS
jgi:hypothetical protein